MKMVQCHECKHENIDGLLYCEDCGAELNDFTDQESLLHEDGTSIRLIIANSGEEIYLPEKEEVIIGREDPVNAIFPDVDTTAYQGEEQGVSRKHARIVRKENAYYLEDLNSLNSTFVNKVKLNPETPNALSDGDEIMLGRLKFHVVLS